MDTELGLSATEELQSGQEVANASNRATETALSQSSRCDFSASALRRTRIGLGEYARTNGMYDPEDVLAFTRLCIDEATARIDSIGSDHADVLLMEALSIASASCGVCKPRRRDSMDSQMANGGVAQVDAPISATESFIATVADQTPIVAVPTSHERSMPSQPLGELPDVRPARLWNSLVQTASRSVWSLLTSMFVRSE